MLRKILILSLLCCIASGCFVSEIIGRSFKPNTNIGAFRIVDTTKMYNLISHKETEYGTVHQYHNKFVLKFYPNGRVGKFPYPDSSDIDALNPNKRRKGGMFNYDGKKILIQYRYNNPQSSGFSIEQIVKSTGDTLQIQLDNFLSTYRAINIPKNIRKHKANWTW